jgi:hypothetical protein
MIDLCFFIGKHSCDKCGRKKPTFYCTRLGAVLILCMKCFSASFKK